VGKMMTPKKIKERIEITTPKRGGKNGNKSLNVEKR
jgi:hypothetical protein